MIQSGTIESRRQNAYLTFKRNLNEGRHGWLRLTPAYSVKLVEDILQGAKCDTSVLDPFSGTGTTALCAAYLGLNATALEINPFLVWFSSVKSKQYQPFTIQETREIGADVAAIAESTKSPGCEPPSIHNISRWWNATELTFLCKIKAAIHKSAKFGSDELNLLLIAFCRTLITLSNAAFNHQSMSFKETKIEHPHLFDISRDCSSVFLKELEFVLNGAAENPKCVSRIIQGDARCPSRHLQGEYHTLITSPPYPNRISYIRELRPYMYWLGYLKNGRDAGESDWQAIGGTWGIATSRLKDWQPAKDTFCPQILKDALSDIARAENRYGKLLANYVAKYFEDIWQHIDGVSRILSDNAEVHYIVGNSTFYGVLLPVEEIYKTMLEHADFDCAEPRRIRKRNSKAELFEYEVMGKKKSGK
jgi:hypothetical protein